MKRKRRKLTAEEKAARKRQRMAETARKYTIGTYKGKVAAVFQAMVRAEAAAKPGPAIAVMEGKIRLVPRRVGQCVCVTCGKVGPWKGRTFGGGPIQTGHFPPGRSASILFEPHAAHPQCVHCNYTLGGNEANYQIWISHVYGPGEPARLKRLRHETRQFTRGELVDMKLEFQSRLKAAEERMKCANNLHRADPAVAGIR
jgi:hypothetical protein